MRYAKVTTLFVLVSLATLGFPLRHAGSGRARAATAHSGHGPGHHPVRLAITVDDLPGGGPEIGGFTHPRIVSDIVATLKAHGVRRATGFVVGVMLENHPERKAALDRWVDAGFEVGNHTYSHSSLAESGLKAYLADIEKNRPLIEELERRTHQSAHYFRYPYLEEGRTEAERRTLGHYLGSHHYTVARVSYDFSDWAWAGPHGRCLEHGDEQAISLLQQSYLANASAYLAWSVAAAHEIVGHSVPQVLLLHANLATASNLDALLTSLEHEGVRYVPLSEALSDPMYTADYASSGGNVFGQASQELHRPHPPWLPRPLELLALACR